MPRTVKPGPTGAWRLVARAQRVGFAQGMRGRGGPWLALGVGAWGLQRLRSMSAKQAEVLLSEPLAPGERIVITNETVTRAEAQRRAEQARKAEKKARKAAKRERKAAKKA